MRGHQEVTVGLMACWRLRPRTVERAKVQPGGDSYYYTSSMLQFSRQETTSCKFLTFLLKQQPTADSPGLQQGETLKSPAESQPHA